MGQYTHSWNGKWLFSPLIWYTCILQRYFEYSKKICYKPILANFIHWLFKIWAWVHRVGVLSHVIQSPAIFCTVTQQLVVSDISRSRSPEIWDERFQKFERGLSSSARGAPNFEATWRVPIIRRLIRYCKEHMTGQMTRLLGLVATVGICGLCGGILTAGQMSNQAGWYQGCARPWMSTCYHRKYAYGLVFV